jgi:hypothetical protein
MPVLSMNHVHIVGTISVTENNIKSPPDTYSQKDGSTSMKTVDALSRRVKRRSDMMSDTIIIYGRFLLFPASPPPRITGKSGSTHGARTVRIPEKKEMRMIVNIH